MEKKVYLAGPEVFLANAGDWFEKARELVKSRSLIPLTPVDGGLTLRPEVIYLRNVSLIQDADVVVANLNCFRGSEPDSGTVFEVGYAVALGKTVIGYCRDNREYKDKVKAARKEWYKEVNAPTDDYGLVEDFGLPLNIMLNQSVFLVQGGLEEAIDKYTSLTAVDRYKKVLTLT